MTQFARPTLTASSDNGITLSTKANGAWQALYSNHAGAAAPPSPDKGQMWVDTSQEGAPNLRLVLRQFSGATWNEIGTMNLVTGQFTTAGGLPLAGGTMTGVIRGLDGTAAAPGYAFSGNANMGMFRIGSNSLGFSTAGVQRIGIGTTTLDINLLTTRFIGSSPIVAIDRDSAAAGANNLRFRIGTSDRWNWQMTGAESSNNAGSNLFLQSFDDAGGLITNFLQFTRSSRQMAINGALIGSAPLTVRTTAASPAEDAIEVMNTNTDLSGSVGINFRTAAGALRGAIRGVRPGNNDGDVYILTAQAGALNTAAVFGANGSLTLSGGLRVAGSGISYASSGDFSVPTAFGWNGAEPRISMLAGGSAVGNIPFSDNIRFFNVSAGLFNILTVGGGNFNINLNPSDRRLKDYVRPSLVDALGEILKIPIVQFSWKHHAFGTDTPPGLQPVGFTTDTLPEDCVNKGGAYESVNLLPLVARLTRAIQQQQDLIQSLEKRLAALEGNS